MIRLNRINGEPIVINADLIEMLEAANRLEFEKAALRRDQIRELRRALAGAPAGPKASPTPAKTVSYGSAPRPSSGRRRAPK